MNGGSERNARLGGGFARSTAPRRRRRARRRSNAPARSFPLQKASLLVRAQSTIRLYPTSRTVNITRQRSLITRQEESSDPGSPSPSLPFPQQSACGVCVWGAMATETFTPEELKLAEVRGRSLRRTADNGRRCGVCSARQCWRSVVVRPSLHSAFRPSHTTLSPLPP